VEAYHYALMQHVEFSAELAPEPENKALDTRVGLEK
jgi:hypothetical protein